MTWRDLSTPCKLYLCAVYGLGLLATWICLRTQTPFNIVWVVFAIASFLVASINLHLPQNPTVVLSMGDVFSMVVLIHFGAGAALITYWANILAASVTTYAKIQGGKFYKRVKYHRFFFNLSACSLSVWSMATIYGLVRKLNINGTIDFILAVGSITLVWFLVNTGTLSVTVA